MGWIEGRATFVEEVKTVVVVVPEEVRRDVACALCVVVADEGRGDGAVGAEDGRGCGVADAMFGLGGVAALRRGDGRVVHDEGAVGLGLVSMCVCY